MEEVDAIPLDTLVSYWTTKFGLDWVKDEQVHKNLFDSLVCMRLKEDKALELAEIQTPIAAARKNGWPQHITTYRIRREYLGDC